jgi:decaprenyl-phosphate phosphoribosyltransferase
MRDYARLLRAHQYLKNLFIFLPLFFSLRIDEADLLAKATLAFVIFSAVSSAVYIFNDYYDVAEDRTHPAKRERPLASGRVSARVALALAAGLLMAGLAASWLLSPDMFSLLVVYVILNAAYSIGLKHIPIVDIFVIAVNFVLRIFVGGAVTHVEIYMWIIIMTFLLALFLALAKRRDDVLIFLEMDQKTRRSIDGYNLVFIDSAMMAMAAVTIVAYIMNTVSHDVIVKFGTDKLYLTTAFVILGILRYMQITFVEEKSGSPTEILLKDRFIQLAILGWIGSFGILIYR